MHIDTKNSFVTYSEIFLDQQSKFVIHNNLLNARVYQLTAKKEHRNNLTKTIETKSVFFSKN